MRGPGLWERRLGQLGEQHLDGGRKGEGDEGDEDLSVTGEIKKYTYEFGRSEKARLENQRT